MSLLKILKGTFENVQRDINSGIKSLAKSEQERSPVSKEKRTNHAGASLLHRFQEYWKEIHTDLAQNALKAKNADDSIQKIHSRIETEHATVTEFVSQLSSLPELTDTIDNLVHGLHSIGEELTSLENQLVALEDLCEQQELHVNKLKHKAQLATYSRNKSIELEQAKVQLSRQHARHVQQFESKLQRELKARQQAFEPSYAEEINAYKTTGRTTLKPNLSSSTGPNLADIEVEAGNEAELDNFLQGVSLPTQDGAMTAEEALEVEDQSEPSVQVLSDEDITEQDLQEASGVQNAGSSKTDEYGDVHQAKQD